MLKRLGIFLSVLVVHAGVAWSASDLHFGTYHALVIGSDNYTELPKLKTAANDARSVAALLQSDYAFNVQLLLNATRSCPSPLDMGQNSSKFWPISKGLGQLRDLFILRGLPAFIRSDNGPEFVAEAVRSWITAVGAQTAYIEPGSPWENGFCESFNARFRDELLNGEIFYSVKEAQIVIGEWWKHYNTVRPHSSLGYRPPAPGVTIPLERRPSMH